MDTIEDPDYKFSDYRAYEHYNPYHTKPIGTLPAGTVIEVKEIRLFKEPAFRVIGEILTGQFVKQKLTFWQGLKSIIVGPPRRSGEVIMNDLCGGKSFDHRALVKNLSEQVE